MRCIGLIVGFLCGGGIALGLFFAGMSMWPPKSIEGSCQVTSLAGVTYQCVGGRGKSFKLNKANVTFEDGSTRLCNTFWLTDKCGFAGSDKPTGVLQGEARPCRWFESEVDLPTFGSAPAGACVEPGQVGTVMFGSISVWILGVIMFFCCFCCGLCSSFKGNSGDSGAPDAKSDNEDVGAQLGGESQSATDAACV